MANLMNPMAVSPLSGPPGIPAAPETSSTNAAAPSMGQGPQSGVQGDMNNDGVIDGADIAMMENLVQMLKKTVKQKATPRQAPQGLMDMSSVMQESSGLLDDKYESEVPPFIQ